MLNRDVNSNFNTIVIAVLFKWLNALKHVFHTDILCTCSKFRMYGLLYILTYSLYDHRNMNMYIFVYILNITNITYYISVLELILLRIQLFHKFFFSIWVFFHEHSRFTGQKGKGEGTYLTPLYYFNLILKH